jgi:membrane associated rhomboid family serine protease
VNPSLVTIIIIVATVAVSIAGFNDSRIIGRLIFDPPSVSRHKQWWRFFSCGLIHADVMHLVFNMYSFWSFGRFVEMFMLEIFGDKGQIIYLLLYVTALAASLIPTYEKNKDNYYYKSLGASGAVSAVIFAGLFLAPLTEVWLLVRVPGFVFGPLYLGITYYMDKRGRDNINHSAHFWGAVYGILFTILLCYTASDYPVIKAFFSQISYAFRGR